MTSAIVNKKYSYANKDVVGGLDVVIYFIMKNPKVFCKMVRFSYYTECPVKNGPNFRLYSSDQNVAKPNSKSKLKIAFCVLLIFQTVFETFVSKLHWEVF